MSSQTETQFGPDYGFGLYVHWPFCSRICPYCDFNVYAAKDRGADDGLVTAIIDDIALHAPRLPRHGSLDTVYFGGGTPSLLKAEQVARILDAARTVFGVKADAEITLEANPNDILRMDLPALAAVGVNRLSIGVQSLRDDVLRFLGRDHNAASARAAVAKALEVFPNTSIDLIYAIPGQTQQAWAEELKAAIALGAPHLSLYELTIEQRTAFGKAVERGEFAPMDDDGQADLYELTQEIAVAEGIPAYEVSNHARTLEYQSQHNHIYWRGGDWIGVGPGAHGRLTVEGKRYATEAHRRPEVYQAQVQALGAGWERGAPLYPLDIAKELLAMGLRSERGIAVARVETVSGRTIPRDKISAFCDEGWMVRDADRLVLTPAGRLLADALTAQLAP